MQKKLGNDKVFIAYPATLKFGDESESVNIIRKEDFSKLEDEISGERVGKKVKMLELSA